MVDELVLHVGLHKTGTSSIQRGLAKASIEHPELGFSYAQTGLLPTWPFAHHAFVSRMVEGDATVLDDLAREVSATTVRRIVMSCEDVSRPEWGWILDKLRGRLPDLPIRAVMFVRDHDLWLESYYAEEVKRGRCTESIIDFYRQNVGLLRFMERIRRIETSLGPGSVTVRTFDQRNFLRDAFEAILGYDGDYGYRFWENNSLSAGSTLALRQMYERFAITEGEVDRIVDNTYRIEHASRNKDNKAYLTPEQRTFIYEDCLADIRALSVAYLGKAEPFWSPARPDKIPETHSSPLEAYVYMLLRCNLKELATL